MTSPHDFPVSVTTLGAAKGGSTLFRHDGKLHLGCVLKSTFQFIPGAPMKQVNTNDLFRAEVYQHDNPCLSIVATSDVVPYLPRVDVVMTGHACAPAGKPVIRQPVRLAIFHGITLLDKTVHVYGDHHGNEFLPFERMPLVYERALGGPGNPQNPHGTGHLAGSALPNIMFPRDPAAVAGFAPISQKLKPRATRLGSLSPAVLEENIPEFPVDFDWSYFHAAPADQQIASLVGNEWIVVEGVNPQIPRVSSRLPSVRPIATIFGTRPDDPEYAQTLQLRIDILRIDADALRCCVISRGIVQLEDEKALSTLRIAGAVETETSSFAHLLTPPPTKGIPKAAMPSGTLRIEEKPVVNVDESIEAPTLRRGASLLGSPAPSGTLEMAAALAPQAPAVLEVNRSLAATLDLYRVDLSKPSVIPPAPPEPEWLDENELIEVHSADPLSNPAAFRLAMSTPPDERNP